MRQAVWAIFLTEKIMQTQQVGLGNLQLELLKLYSNNISDKCLFDIKLLLSNYFAQKATEAMDRVWEEDNLTEQEMINWTNEHNRYQGSH
jgi:hypothetical protein